MHILGLSCYFHDAAAALLRDGELVAAAEEERFSRVKHDFAFPPRPSSSVSIGQAFASQDLDYVAFFEKPFIKFERILQTALATAPRSATVFRQAMTGWLLDKLWVKTLIRNTLDIRDERILFVEHHQSHAASAFFCSPFDEAAILTVDGVGEWTTTALGRGSGTDLQLTAETRFPHSLGLLYSAFTAWLGFEVNEGEYKVMGMAPYGVPRYVDKVRKVVDIHGDGSFSLDLDYFTFHYSATRTYSRKFEALFGAAASARASVLHGRHRVPVVLRTEAGQLHRAGPRQPALRRYRGQHPGRDRRDRAGTRSCRACPDGLDPAVHGRRRGSQQRGERPHSS